ncbi:TadE/TadG family type IV pilus assembly protein [Sphingomonas sp. OK281]|uniref:TadE/TadG family type IV pilus assembly protein n=1 Tax=Sphingomonas sp. OK281 TaxID=1881067 RepID=UPI0008DF549F|nr:TadE/TadG family type IV pilus assembly protein [Sphingomonas sp. OK281]SFN69103.1 TadE-like protein [Sphingomonas sp. OK281]
MRRGLFRDRRAVAMLEFALMLPLFLGFLLTAIEFANYIMANNRVQRMAAMSADLVAQSGTGDIGIGEGQIYDLFSALDLTSRPYDLRNDGRIVITGVRGTDTDNNGTVENRILWQRFDGGYVIAPQVGCNKTTAVATLPNGRRMLLDEILFHVQVSYKYRPIMSDIPFRMLSLPVDFTRIAMFRARNKDFQSPTPDDRFPPKDKCTTANGL